MKTLVFLALLLLPATAFAQWPEVRCDLADSLRKASPARVFTVAHDLELVAESGDSTFFRAPSGRNALRYNGSLVTVIQDSSVVAHYEWRERVFRCTRCGRMWRQRDLTSVSDRFYPSVRWEALPEEAKP